MKTEYLLIGIVVVLVLAMGFQAYSILGLSQRLSAPSAPAVTTAAIAPLPAPSQLTLPANIQSSAPIQFKSFEEEVAYYKKNAKNPKNINIENAVRNMDANHDGQCDKCGMAILHCIESGMENM